MHLSGFKDDPHLMVESDSDLENINPDFLKDKYVVRLAWSGFSPEFMDTFIDKFKDVTNFDMGIFADEAIGFDFVYRFKKLEGLVFPLYKGVDFVLDCAKLPKSLYSLHFYVYTKNKLKNIEALNKTNLQHLVISGYEERDLTKLSCLTNLKTLSFKTARIRSLKGIEALTNLKCLSLGGVRVLTDISDIVSLQNLKYLEFDICWKLQDFSPIGNLKELEVLQLLDCKNLASIKFVEKMPKLEHLATLGTTIINDYDTTPAKNIPIYFGSRASNKYNQHYPEKEIMEGHKTWSTYNKS